MFFWKYCYFLKAIVVNKKLSSEIQSLLQSKEYAQNEWKLMKHISCYIEDMCGKNICLLICVRLSDDKIKNVTPFPSLVSHFKRMLHSFPQSELFFLWFGVKEMNCTLSYAADGGWWFISPSRLSAMEKEKNKLSN